MKLVASSSGRIDKLIANALPQYSRAALAKLFEQGLVNLDGITAVKPGHKVREGAMIEVDTSPLEQELQVVELPIIYEDDDVVVINKPAGIISHSRGKFWYEPSVASFLRWHQMGAEYKKNIKGRIIPNAKHTPSHLKTVSYDLDPSLPLESERAGIVHRLDRATSGVMICAKNDNAMAYLQKQFSNRSVKKTYIAIVEGVIEPEEAIIDAPIERNPKKPSEYRVGPRGKSSQTHYKVVKNNEKYTLVEFTPKTGRTHQLRIHSAYIKYPILGDNLYGTAGERLYLHAKSLELKLPDGQLHKFSAPVPKEFDDVL